MTQEQQLEQALKNLLAIIDSNEWAATESWAWAHGYSVSKEVGMRHHGWVQGARDLVEK